MYDWDVFISHSTKDHKIVLRLANNLRKNGVRVWLDDWEMKPGSGLIRKIDEGLAKSRWLLVVHSSNYVESKWCEPEWQAMVGSFIENQSWRVLIITLDNTPISPLLSIPFRLKNNWKSVYKALQPYVTIREYCEQVTQRPITDWAYGTSGYEIEPADLLPIRITSVGFQSGEIIQPLRIEFPIPGEEFQEIIAGERHSETRTSVVLGEAGVGKTTMCRLFCHKLARWANSKSRIPIYVPLGMWERGSSLERLLDQQVGLVSFQELNQAVRDEGGRLLIFFDGWNEQNAEQLEHVSKLCRKCMETGDADIVVTSRPVVSLDSIICSRDSTRYFEIQRWTDEQLHCYFSKNGRAHLLQDKVPDAVRNCLRLPLIASRLLASLEADQAIPSFLSVSQVFDYLLKKFIAQQKNRAVRQPSSQLLDKLEDYLCKLALRMTNDRIVQIKGEVFKRILSEEDSSEFELLLRFLIDSGLMRRTGTTVVLDPEAEVTAMENLDIAFLHQAFQEYLTAKAIMSRKQDIPLNASHDAFWREVPVYIAQSYEDANEQHEFAEEFFRQGDYLTCARVLQEISDPGYQTKLREKLIEVLADQLIEKHPYQYIIETYRLLGIAGRDALRCCLHNSTSQMHTVFAEPEAHLLNKPPEDAREDDWCLFGRSIYYLGEIGDIWLAQYLSKHVEEITSIHLRYHVGEALLSLARIHKLNKNSVQPLGAAAKKLISTGDDPVVFAYGHATLRALDYAIPTDTKITRPLKDFLLNKVNTSDAHFNDEFWQRAHGAEAFSEFADTTSCVDVLTRLFQAEDKADYSHYWISGYSPVQSATLKAAMRSMDRHPGSTQEWKCFLEGIFQSNRIDSNTHGNKWAINLVERLLVRWYTSKEDQDWINKWSKSNCIGPNIRKALMNALYLAT
ncbi:MAG: TIR domain-containing protein [Armatimonadota bacterium]